MSNKELLYYTTIGHIENTGVVSELQIITLSSIGIPAYTYKMESTNIEEFLEKVQKDWNVIKDEL